MNTNLEVIVAAFREQWRQRGLGLVVGSAVAAALMPSAEDRPWPWLEGLALLIGVIAPASAAFGVQRWIRRGPLGLAGAAGWDAATAAGYGLGTALWALPFALADWFTLSWGGGVADVGLGVAGIVSLLGSTSCLGAASGRVARGPIAAVVGALALVACTALLYLVGLAMFGSWLQGVIGAQVMVASFLGIPAVASIAALSLAGRGRRSELALGR